MINIGSKQLKGISVGNRAVKAVYKGSQKVWSSASWVNVSLTKYSFGTTTSNSGTTEVISSSLNVSDIMNVTFRLSGSFFSKLSYTDTSGNFNNLNSSPFNDLIVSTSRGAIVSVTNNNSMVKISINSSKQIEAYYYHYNKSASLTINKIELLQ